jgi:hypothetical protein
MTEEQLDALGPALDDFLQPYLFCCGYTQTLRWTPFVGPRNALSLVESK